MSGEGVGNGVPAVPTWAVPWNGATAVVGAVEGEVCAVAPFDVEVVVGDRWVRLVVVAVAVAERPDPHDASSTMSRTATTGSATRCRPARAHGVPAEVHGVRLTAPG